MLQATTEWFTFTASFGKKNPEIKQECIETFIETEVMPHIEGFKIVETRGVSEGLKDSFDIIVISDEHGTIDDKLRKIHRKYAKKFSQESIRLECRKCNIVEFVR